MRINAFLHESPMFAVSRAARRFEALAGRALGRRRSELLEGLVLAALFFEAPGMVKPSQLAETFGTTRGNVSHCVSSLEAKGCCSGRSILKTRAPIYWPEAQGKRAHCA